MKKDREEKSLQARIKKLLEDNNKALCTFEILERDIEVQTLLDDANRISIDRMRYNDHGKTHALIATMNGIKILRELRGSLKTTIETDGIGTFDDSEVAVVISCYLHDIGMVAGRPNHDMFSTIIAMSVMDRMLGSIYQEDSVLRTHIKSHVIHAIYCHDLTSSKPLTVEAAIVSVADATDMTEGRSRIPFSTGRIDIHTVSAKSITDVKIERGVKKPVAIIITMYDSPGIFQVQELLAKKIIESTILEDYTEIKVKVIPGENVIKEMDIL